MTYLFEKILKRPQYSLDIFERVCIIDFFFLTKIAKIFYRNFFLKEFISDQLSTDSRNPTLRDLGVEFRKFDESVSWSLKVFNKLNYYNEKLNEFPEPKAPKPLSEDFEFQLRRKIRQSNIPKEIIFLFQI